MCSFSLNLYGASALPRLAAFRGWLRQSASAAAVRSLRLEARQSFACSLRLERFSADELEQLHSGLLQCAAACSGLRQLRVVMPKQWHFLPDVDVCSLAAGLPRLQLLHLSLPATRLVVEAPLVSLPQLLDLRLLGQPAWLGPAAALPPALTRLGLGEFDRGQEECPPQVCQLPSPHALSHASCMHGHANMSGAVQTHAVGIFPPSPCAPPTAADRRTEPASAPLLGDPGLRARCLWCFEPPGQPDRSRAEQLPMVSWRLCSLPHASWASAVSPSDASSRKHASNFTLFMLLTFRALPCPCFCSLPPPEALRPLINLQALAVSTWGDSAGLDAALQALPQLTALFLDVRPSLPPAVAGLAQLQRFVWDSGEPPASALPGGPWLSSLRKVALLCPMILSRIHVLQTATQLEHLGLASLYDAMQGDTYGLLLFAREHPTLQQLHLCAGLGVSSREVAAYVAGHTPRLSVSFVERRADLVRTVVPDLAEWL